MNLTPTARRRSALPARLAVAVATAALTASIASCGNASGTGGESSPVSVATFKERMIRAADGSPIIYGWAYGNGVTGGGSLSILKDGQEQLVGVDGELSQSQPPAGEPPIATIAAEDIPVEHIQAARDGVTCDDNLPATVAFQPLPTGKVWFQSECSQNPQKQIVDGKVVPELDDPLSAETLATVLAEQRTALGLTSFTEISIMPADGGGDATIAFQGPLKTSSGQCNAGITRHFTVKDAAVAGIDPPGCESASRNQPFSLDGVTAKQLAAAMAKGVKSAGGGYKSVTIHAGSNKVPVIDVLGAEAPGMARVGLDGKPIK